MDIEEKSKSEILLYNTGRIGTWIMQQMTDGMCYCRENKVSVDDDYRFREVYSFGNSIAHNGEMVSARVVIEITHV